MARLVLSRADATLPQSGNVASIGYVNVVVRSAKVSEDGKNLNVEVKNVGTVKLLKADVNLSKPFQADIQSLSNLEVNARLSKKAISIPS